MICVTMFHAQHSRSRFCVMLCPDFFLYMSVWLSLREWYLNGNYLIIIVSTLIILPLALMRQLGMFFILSSHIFISLPRTSILYCHLFCFFLFTSHPCHRTETKVIIPSLAHESFCIILLSLLHRLLGLHQRLFPLLHGVFPNFGKFEILSSCKV